ncbi:carbonic anhydrase [Bacillus swezeyi]|uniref:carbonic anhydrase n=1 Tax=Bacillus swezeyi TaxID=1925020 RepID=UPI0027DE821D|nr:carbonic anhydrase [Bacillus swezeyi]
MNKKLIYSFLAVSLSLSLGACSKITSASHHTNEEVHWSYEEEAGPEHWGELKQANSACINGSEQSPIHIDVSQVKTDRHLDNIQIQYESAPFTLVNNGHTIQANARAKSSSIFIEGHQYKLVQFHFHTPSEHQLNGKSYAMELHLVHKDENGKIAVLGVMIQEGKENQQLASIWDVLPKKETVKDISLNEQVDLQRLLPQEKTAFHYNGSLTTPPCTEKVKWYIFEQSIEMSKKQIQAFQQIFPDNHRPVQPLNKRNVLKLG